MMKITTEVFKNHLPTLAALLFSMMIILFICIDILSAWDRPAKAIQTPEPARETTKDGCLVMPDGIEICDSADNSSLIDNPTGEWMRSEVQHDFHAADRDFMPICGLAELPRFSDAVNLRPPKAEAVNALGWMTDQIGISANFRILAADFTRSYGAFAAIRDRQRWIVYNSAELFKAPDGKLLWDSLGTLGHELGHHLAGHTASSNQPNHVRELEADRFSGFILSRLGATLEQAVEWTHDLNFSDTPSHPARAKRTAAAMEGWEQAERLKRQGKSSCVTDWIGKPYELDLNTCRIGKMCKDGKSEIRLACQYIGDSWYWVN